MPRVTPRPGTFWRIRLADGSFGYGRMLEQPYGAFYEYRTASPEAELGRIASQNVLFKVALRHSGSPSWEIIGWRELEEHLSQPIIQFKQSIGDFRRCTIFDTAGNVRTAEPKECVGLERASVWEQHHVEERLLDFFMERPNALVERMKVRLQSG